MSLKAKRIIFFSLVIAYILYTSFVYTAGTITENLISDEAAEGRQIFREKNCISCHQLYGLGGYMGPDLTNVISNKGENYVRTYLEIGTAKMPDFELEENEILDLISYLKYIDNTSTYPLRDIEITWYGTVIKRKNEN
jgi:nitric oxide reductase subunit C